MQRKSITRIKQSPIFMFRWAWTTATRSYPASLADISNQTPHPQILAEKQLHIKLILKLIHFQAKACRVTQTKEERVC